MGRVFRYKVNYRQGGSKKIRTKIVELRKEHPSIQNISAAVHASNLVGINWERVDYISPIKRKEK